jgi:hypothetical protein
LLRAASGSSPEPRGDDHSARLILSPVADVVAGEIIVPTVYLPYPRSVQVHRDRQAVARVPYPVNASVVGQYARGSVLPAPQELPDLFQAGMIGPGAVVQALVALFEYGSHSTAENSPGGMVVDLGLGARRPDEDLQREGMVLAFVAMGHVPAFFCASRLLQEGKNLSLKKGGILRKISHEGNGSLQSQFRRKLGELL